MVSKWVSYVLIGVVFAVGAIALSQIGHITSNNYISQYGNLLWIPAAIFLCVGIVIITKFLKKGR